VNALYGLHEALVMLQEEGLENSWARHLQHHKALRAGLENLGFEYIGKDDARLPQLNAVKLPAGVDEAKLRTILLNEFNLEIGAGLGALAGKILRIGLMGHASNNRNVLFCLAALESALAQARSSAPVAARA
jgi:alanine-glyoxylate transaminase / serine-glyoxylate transaminase / serine-pyruvate transaminase